MYRIARYGLNFFRIFGSIEGYYLETYSSSCMAGCLLGQSFAPDRASRRYKMRGLFIRNLK